MPQISLYIDKKTLHEIEKAAEKEHVSISKWVGENIKKVIKDEYPVSYFDLFGSISDDTFDAPVKKSFKDDAEREQL